MQDDNQEEGAGIELATLRLPANPIYCRPCARWSYLKTVFPCLQEVTYQVLQVGLLQH